MTWGIVFNCDPDGGHFDWGEEKSKTWRRTARISSPATSSTIIETVKLVAGVKEPAGEGVEVGAAGAHLPDQEEEGEGDSEVEERLVQVSQLIFRQAM